MPEKMCACGKPLHYTSELTQHLVETMIADLGDCVKITVMELGRAFMVPRHFIALHTITGRDLPKLAEQYGFKEIKP
jgi:hypothetical protein